MIIEGLLSTDDTQGGAHFAPMGPLVNQDLTEWTLRPFQSSSTFRNLRASNTGVFHVTDDVLIIARAALGEPQDLECSRHERGGWIWKGACSWFRLEVHEWDTSQLRSEARAAVTDRGELRAFWGWNRAKHAVLEATILATRLHLASRAKVSDELERLRPAVEKTAGDREREAWELVLRYIAEHSVQPMVTGELCD